VPRLFISHSSKDNIAALAFQRWLIGQGWSAEDIFIDLHDIGAGERWRDTLRKANASCEAVLVLASPDSLDSSECQREIMLAEELQKPLIVAILRDLAKTDPRLGRWSDTQFVDLSAEPPVTMEALEREGRVYRDIKFNLAALQSIKTRLEDLGIAPGSFAWQPAKEGEGPYPGLGAFDEADAGLYFGREADMMVGLSKLRRMRKGRSPRLLVIVAASGAGKSSYLRAGLWPRLKRDPDFAPLAIVRPAPGIISGPDGVGQRIAPFFERYGKRKVPGDIEIALKAERPSAVAALLGLLTEATDLATMARQAGNADARAPAPLIAIDQGEELFATENAAESERFLELLATVLEGATANFDPYVLVTIRADSVEALLQRWPLLGLDAPESLYLPPLATSAYRDVIVRPAEVYTRQVRRLAMEPGLVHQLTHDAQGADALPLLAFTLEKLFKKFGADGNLTVERYQGIGGIGGSIDVALSEAQRQAGLCGTLENLKRLIVPGLATWDMGAGAAKRIVAHEATLVGEDTIPGRSGASPDARSGLKPLADALVANRLLTRGAGTLEVAHEALLRRQPIAGWLEVQKDSLKLRDDILREAEDWAHGGRHVESLVRRGARLETGLALQANPDFATALAPAREYLDRCKDQEELQRRKDGEAAELNAALNETNRQAYEHLVKQEEKTKLRLDDAHKETASAKREIENLRKIRSDKDLEIQAVSDGAKQAWMTVVELEKNAARLRAELQKAQAEVERIQKYSTDAKSEAERHKKNSDKNISMLKAEVQAVKADAQRLQRVAVDAKSEAEQHKVASSDALRKLDVATKKSQQQKGQLMVWQLISVAALLVISWYIWSHWVQRF